MTHFQSSLGSFRQVSGCEQSISGGEMTERRSSTIRKNSLRVWLPNSKARQARAMCRWRVLPVLIHSIHITHRS